MLRSKKLVFGSKLRLLRNRKELTKDYCVEEIGCSLRTFYRWEKGISYPLKVYHSKILELFPELFKV